MLPDGKQEFVVASHQPDLLPYTGFWYKMAHADVFELAVHDQFQDKGYQRRVTMRGQWANVPLADRRRGPIVDLIVTPESGGHLWDTIRGRYATARFWKTRRAMVHDWLEKAFVEDRLWMVNASLIASVAEYLSIDTPIVRAEPQELTAAARVAERVAQLGGTVYLSGTGARAYMEEEDRNFTSRGIRLEWSKHQPTTGDSILTAIFDDRAPRDTVMKQLES